MYWNILVGNFMGCKFEGCAFFKFLKCLNVQFENNIQLFENKKGGIPQQ